MDRRGRGLLAGALLAALAGLLGLGMTHGGGDRLTSTAAAADQPRFPGELLRFSSHGRDRAVLLQVPAAGVRVRGAVLVLPPHALSVARAAHDLPMDDLRAAGFVVAYPSHWAGDWNAGTCCGTAQRLGVDDVGFLDDVRARLLARFQLSPAQVGLAGYSTGGQMVYRMLCERPSFAAAVLVVAGSLETSCAPTAPLPPTLVVHGLRDTTLPWAFMTRPNTLLGHSTRPAFGSVVALATAAGCGEPAHRGDLLRWACPGAPSLTVAEVPLAGHAWQDLDGSTRTLSWMTKHLPA